MTESVKEKMDAQTQCIKDHDGKWLVIAGPGTGKTYTVTHRIADMINSGISPSSILCLTFTEIAAREMKQKIGETHSVDVFTYHGFCSNVMSEFPDEFDLVNPTIITDDSKRTFITACIDELLKEKSKGNAPFDDDVQGYLGIKNPYSQIKYILDGIDRIKMERISKEQFEYNYTHHPAWEPRIAELENVTSSEETLRAYLMKQTGLISEKQYVLNAYLALRNKSTDIPQYDKLLNWEEKQKNILLDDIKNIKNNILKMQELWKLYERYEALKKEENCIDFNDMINMVLNKFDDEKSNLLNEIGRKYEYIIVDEYQDTNTSQNQIVFNLAKCCPNIFVVGDDDQIIYTFQGAHLDTIQKFLEKARKDDPVGHVNVKCFTDNYRSTQPVLDVSRALAELQDDNFYKFMVYKGRVSASESDKKLKLRFLSQNTIVDDDGNVLVKKLLSKNPELKDIKEPVEFYSFETKEEERDYIVKKVIQIKKEIDEYNENLSKGEEPKRYSDIAILTNRNKDLDIFADYLKVNNIPVEVLGKNIFDITSVNVFISYLQFLTNPEKYSDKLLSYLLLRPFHIPAKDYARICATKTHYKTLLENIKSYIYKCENPKEPDKTPEEKDKLKEFLATYDYLRDYIVSENYKTSLLEIGRCTGIFDYYINNDLPNKVENIKGIRKLLDIADGYFDVNKDTKKSFTMFVEYLSKMMESTAIKLDKDDKPANAVQLSTLHSSKGREFEYVFMPALTAKTYETLNSSDIYEFPQTPQKDESYDKFLEHHYQEQYLDSIKLLYVGITRAKRKLFLSYADEGANLSWFIRQLLENTELISGDTPVLKTLSDKEVEKVLDTNIFEAKPHYSFAEEFKNELEPLIPNKFSYSGLNRYIACPKQFFYKYILGIKSPGGNADDFSIGTAVHKAFEEACIYVMNNKEYPSAEYAQEKFEEALGDLEISNPDYTKMLAAKKIFSENGYYNEHFVKLVDAKDLAKDAVFEKNIPLNNEPNDRRIFVEYHFNYEMDMPAEWRTSIDDKDTKIILDGYIDRLDKDSDGKYIIYDYKTGETFKGITPSQSYFYQMVFYKYVLENRFPGIEVKECYFLFPLEKNGKYKNPVHDKFIKVTSKQTTDYFQEKVNEFKDAIAGIRCIDFEKQPPKAATCSNCDYQFLCKNKLVGEANK